MTLGADAMSWANHLAIPRRRWRWLSVGGKCFVFVNFLNIYKYSLKARRGVMLCHLFSRRTRSPGPLNKSSSLFLLRGKRLRHSRVLGVTSRWCWRRRKRDISVSLRQVKHSSWKHAGVKSEVRNFLCGSFAFAEFTRRLLEMFCAQAKDKSFVDSQKIPPPRPNLCPSSKDLMTGLDS